MAQVSVTRTYGTGGGLSASNYNDDRDEIINGVNSINNSQIDSDADIAESKLSFGGTSGQYPSSDGDGTLTWGSLTLNRGFTWGVGGTLTVANEQSMKFIVPQAMTVTKLWAKTESGTCTIRIQSDTTTVGTLDVTSAVGSTTSFSSTALTAGQVLTLDISAISSGQDVYVTLECSQP